MKIEIFVSKAELDKILEQVKEDSALVVEQGQDGNLNVRFTSAVITPSDFADMVVQDLGIEMDDKAVESVTLTQDGGADLVLTKRL